MSTEIRHPDWGMLSSRSAIRHAISTRIASKGGRKGTVGGKPTAQTEVTNEAGTVIAILIR